jgi:hypothetical protein
VALGIVNAAVLAGGWSVIRFTRHLIAGKAITLLACLVMPLNLWYYHTNGLLTVDGHLWAAAVVISVLYAASAWVLKDEMFVYIFAAGVTMTGLLILADLPPSPQKFWEIASPATLLVVLGLLGIHAERAFPEQDGPFSRKRFGRAFFFSGHAQLAAGLLLLLAAQVAGDWLYEPVFKLTYAQWKAQPSPIVTQFELRLLAFGLVVAGTYAYIYSDLAVRRVGVYVYIAAFTLMWAEVLGVQLLHLDLGTDAVIAILATTALIVNGIQATLTKESQFTRAFPVLGLLLGMISVLIGVAVYFQALSGGELRGVWTTHPPAWTYVGAMLLTALSCRAGAHLYRHSQSKLAVFYFFATAAATMVFAVALLSALGLTHWVQHAPWMMLIPIAYLIAAQLYRGHASEMPLLWCAHAATGVMLISSLATAIHSLAPLVEGDRVKLVEGQTENLILALFCAEAAVFYGLAAAWRQQMKSLEASVILACAALWQVLTYWRVEGEVYTLTFAFLGLGLLVIYRFALVEAVSAGKLARGAFQAANTLLSLSFMASWFMGLSRIATHGVDWSYVGLCLGLGLMALSAIRLVRESGWRRWYVVASIAQGLLTFLAIQTLSHLSPAQKLEIFCVAVGLLLLVLGHIGWYREQDRHSDMVSVSLLLGSLLTCLPLAIATLIDRGRGDFSGIHFFNELGFLAASVLLLITGFLFQLRSTTLTGAASTALYFLTLLVYVPWNRMDKVAMFIFGVGLVIFLPALLLSLYRDRLMALPEKLRKREGVFRVLNWR